MRRTLGVAAALVVAAVALLPTPAWADGVTVRTVDTSRFPEVRMAVLVNGAAPRTTEFHVRENGVVVPDGAVEVRPLRQTSNPVGTVLVIDTSGSMRSRGAIDQAKAAARQFIASRAANEWTALVSVASQATVRQDFTQDAAALTAAVDALQADGETALWDGLAVAAHLYDDRPDLQANVVLLSDGADSVSTTTEAQAVAALTGAHAAVFAVGIASDDFDPSRLAGLSGASGGSFSASTDPADLGVQFGRIRAAIENQYEVRYTSTGPGGALSVDLTVGALTAEVQARAGSTGVASSPRPVAPAQGPFSGSGAKYLVLLLAGLAAGLGAAALLVVFGRGDERLEDQLGMYLRPAAADVGEPDHDGDGSLAETGLVQRAVALTSKVADRGGSLQKVAGLLEQADVPLRPAEALFFYAAGVVLLGLLALLGAPSPAVGLMVAGLVAALPVLFLKTLRARRLKAFETQLPDTLNLLAGSLRAGYSFLQCVETVAQEASDPMARELRRVLAEARLGRPVEDALGDVAARMQSQDFEWTVMAIRIQREVGGNLAELLQTVSDTMVQRARMRGEVKALTAEGRMSAVIMGLLPVALGLFMLTAAPDYIQTLFSSVTGWAMIGASALMAVAGMAWIQKIVKVEI
ncbi:MAG: type II secretion system F family protein [Actinomycetota bacterium]|jgi:tight adherence protein B